MRHRMINAFLVLAVAASARAGVVINEVFYNAPEDLDNLQWLELHNTDDQPVNLGGWGLDEGKLYVFPDEARIAARGHLVIALDPDLFKRYYSSEALGPFKRPLKRGGERLTLMNAQKTPVDTMRYGDRDPWPLSADGESASLERICPTSPGDAPENWAASRLPDVRPRPSGTPGKQNDCHLAGLPPVVSIIPRGQDDVAPDQPLRVDARVRSGETLREVSLLYRVVTNGQVGPEASVRMTGEGDGGRYWAAIPGQKAGALIRYRIRAVGDSGVRRFCPAENDLRPTFSAYVHTPAGPAPIARAEIIRIGEGRPQEGPGDTRRGPGGPPGIFLPFGRDRETPPRPPRGTSAFVFVDSKAGKVSLFDHVNVVERPGRRGFKVFFHKDRLLKRMSAVSILHEGVERFLFAEALAYEVYRRAGNPSSQAEFVRLRVDDRTLGHQLMVERPNRAFLRRNRINDDGNLYKLTWFGNGLVGQHVKKTHTRGDHQDLISVVDQLNKTTGDEQWKVIQDHFDVNQVATYFAVNAVISHWDGFFNNHLVYHDLEGSGKWMMFPWDQDKTWGYYDGLPEDQVFYDMPLTFGMTGDQHPGGNPFGGGPFGGGPGGFGPGGPPPFGPPGGRAPGQPGGPPPGTGPGAQRGPGGPEGERGPGGPGGREAPRAAGSDAPRGPDGQGGPPGPRGRGGRRGMGDRGGMWWRPPGHFSGPLLANPQFRKVFLARTREILEKVYTEEVFFPLMDDLAERVKTDAASNSQPEDSEPALDAALLARNVESLKTHLRKRREFLLQQPELSGKPPAPAASPSAAAP